MFLILKIDLSLFHEKSQITSLCQLCKKKKNSLRITLANIDLGTTKLHFYHRQFMQHKLSDIFTKC